MLGKYIKIVVFVIFLMSIYNYCVVFASSSNKMPPKVSVVIPNYNHALYLPQRIDSVLGQTFKDIELILMDDCSKDNSREIIEKYALLDQCIRVVYNEKNSGSTFKQWNKGIELSRGEYVWIAESDDFAESIFLESLLSILEADKSIGIAYSDSLDVDADSKIIGSQQQFYDKLNSQLWKQNFVENGLALVKKFMFYQNIIPNASAVVMRVATVREVGYADETFRVNGDWVFWAGILAHSKVAFLAKTLNYFRRHLNNVRSSTIVDGTALLEMTRLLQVLKSYGEPDPFFFDKMMNELTNMWLRSIIDYKIARSRHVDVYNNLKKADKMFLLRLVKLSSNFLFSNNLSGLRQLLGDGLLYRFMPKAKQTKGI